MNIGQFADAPARDAPARLALRIDERTPPADRRGCQDVLPRPRGHLQGTRETGKVNRKKLAEFIVSKGGD
jgi:hypothetical protein